MKSIAQFVKEGIRGPGELVDALQTAMQLEFSTIPPYLCAQWSIKPETDPNGVGSLIKSIAVQEMYHFALAGNILSAIGSSPRIATAGFLPPYPTNVLPGGITQRLAVDLLPLSPAQLDVFMQIENPQFDPVVIPAPALPKAAQPPPTIGDFYDTIIKALQDAPPQIDPAAKCVAYGEAVQITSVKQAIQIIEQIKDEGEGTPQSPSQGPSGSGKLAHFYTFRMIKLGKRYVLKNGKWITDPAAIIQMPDTFTFKPGDSTDFSKMVTKLLVSLENNWKDGSDPDTDAMDVLRDAGVKLIQQGIRPEFKWVV